jgi:hypothetical protein
MGKILPSYKKAVIEEVIDNVFSTTSQYFAFAANPVAYDGDPPNIVENDYSMEFTNNWQMLFGKKINSTDIVPVITKNSWIENTVYDRYDNTSTHLIKNNNYYVVTNPSTDGASYHIYKCIDNANGSLSTVSPGSIGTPTQVSTFQTSDGYKWRYIYTISELNNEKFSSGDYVPVYTNSTISSTASSYSGVEVVMIANSGSGYVAYTNGTVLSVTNSTVVQIENYSSSSDNFYVKNSIYIYNTIETTSQLRTISDYVSNSSGKFVKVSVPLDTSTILGGISQYSISPAVVFDTDGTVDPKAYSIIDSENNSIQKIVMLDIGSNISWANVKIESSYGSGANLYAIVPPSGGHGADPIAELDVKGFAVSFNFSNTENETIPPNLLYNKIGLIKNPFTLVSNSITGTVGKGEKYSSNTFDQILTANINPSYVFNDGETVRGTNSGAKGIVVFSNTSQVHISGDKYFKNGEFIANSSGIPVGSITINRVGDIYTKDLKPIYIENINNVNRNEIQTELFKLTIEI